MKVRGSMFKIGDTVMHGREACLVADILRSYQEGEDFYVLKPVQDNSLTIKSPAHNRHGLLRPVITKEETEALIQSIPSIETVDVDSRSMEATYKSLMDSGKHSDLIRIIKTTYLRRKDKISSGKKVGETDKTYFRQAERTLYSELAVVLDKSYDDTRDYVVGRVSALSASAS